MDAFALRLIHRAPFYLVMLALAFLVIGIVNTVTTYSNYVQTTGGNGSAFAFLYGSLFGALYQPAVLLGWAAAIYYLSQIAGRMGA